MSPPGQVSCPRPAPDTPLAPLVLPPADSVETRPGPGCCPALTWAERRALLGQAGDRPAAPADPDERIRYRWLLGHQVTFCLWRSHSQLLRRIAADRAPSARAMELAARLHHTYAVLLLYTASCSPERYAATVRTDMTSCDPAFSGTWARDHQPLPGLVRRVRLLHPGAPSRPLRAAAVLTRQVHLAVAEKLVPGGRSLLQQAGQRPQAQPTPAEQDRYDVFFGVERAPVCEHSVARQLACRVNRILVDLAEHGLHDLDHAPAALRAAHPVELRLLERHAPLLLRRLVPDAPPGGAVPGQAGGVLLSSTRGVR